MLRLRDGLGVHGERQDQRRMAEPVLRRLHVGNARLLEVDLRTMRRTAIFRTGADPDVLTFDEPARRLYVLAESGIITVLDVGSTPARLIARGHLADGAHSGTVDELLHQLFVPIANAGGHPAVRVYDETNLTPTS